LDVPLITRALVQDVVISGFDLELCGKRRSGVNGRVAFRDCWAGGTTQAHCETDVQPPLRPTATWTKAGLILSVRTAWPA